MSDTDKSTSETFALLWAGLSHNQQRFAVAMLESATKKEAAEVVGLKPNTVYGWNGIIDDVVNILRNDMVSASVGIMSANAIKAAMVKAAGLDSRIENIRQGVATEILDRNLGKPTQRSEITGKGGEPLQVEYVEDWRTHAND